VQRDNEMQLLIVDVALPVVCLLLGRVMKRENSDFSHLAAAHVVSSDELAAAGKALREEVLRKAHGWWKPAEDRANLIDTLRKLDEGRMKEKLPICYGRMLQSPFAFYRSAIGVMSADLAQTPTTGVQARGDCHLMNLGLRPTVA
jgi:hypothetical protein